MLDPVAYRYVGMETPIWFEDFLDGTFTSSRKYKSYKEDASLKWSDIQSSLNFAPEQKNHALTYIKRCLGYIPDQAFYLPHISFVQTLLKNMESGIISQSQFIDEVIEHMKHIRNDEMKKEGWVQRRNPSRDMRKVYREFLPQFKDAARERLCCLVGFKPDLKYSLDAELHLRTLFEKDYFRPDLPFCEHDFKAATIMLYRKNYYLFDEAIADHSNLFALDFEPFVLNGEQTFTPT